MHHTYGDDHPSAAAASRPVYVVSSDDDIAEDLLGDDEYTGPMTRSRASKRTVVASTFRAPSTPINTASSAALASRVPATAPVARYHGGKGKGKAPAAANASMGPPSASATRATKPVVIVEIESLRHDMRSMQMRQPPRPTTADAGTGTVARTPQQQQPGSTQRVNSVFRSPSSPWASPIAPLTPAQSSATAFRPQVQNAQQQTTPSAFGGVGVGHTPRGMAGAAADTVATECDVELLKLVATGGQASVFLARLPLDHNSLVIVKVFFKKPSAHELAGMRAMSMTNYAIRLIGETRVSRNQLLPFERDLKGHPHNISMAAFEFDPRSGYLTGWCYERLQGDLEHCLLEKKTPVGNAMKMLVALQIAYFLRGVHHVGYIFRDLKPSNILLNTRLDNVPPEDVVKYFLQHYPVIKVTDFGLVTMEKKSNHSRCAGTMGYMSAKQMLTSDYDRSVDVTAYAITLAEILIEDLIFDTNDKDEDIEAEFRSLRVIDRIAARFARCRQYIPSALAELIYDTLRGNNRSVETFIAVLEASLKGLAFAFDVTKSDMQLLNQGMATPARPILVGEDGEPVAAAATSTPATRKHADKDTVALALHAYFVNQMPTAVIAACFGKNERTVLRWIAAYESEDRVGPLPERAAVPRKFFAPHVEWIVQYYRDNPAGTHETVKIAFEAHWNLSISASCISRLLARATQDAEFRASRVDAADLARFTTELNELGWVQDALVFADIASFDSRDMCGAPGHETAQQISLLLFAGVDGLLKVYATDGEYTRHSFAVCCDSLARSGKVYQHPGRHSIWVMDPATARCNEYIAKHLSDFGLAPIMLPANCHFLNPARILAGAIKRELRRQYAERRASNDGLLATLIPILRPLYDTCMRDLYSHCGYVLPVDQLELPTTPVRFADVLPYLAILSLRDRSFLLLVENPRYLVDTPALASLLCHEDAAYFALYSPADYARGLGAADMFKDIVGWVFEHCPTMSTTVRKSYVHGAAFAGHNVFVPLLSRFPEEVVHAFYAYLELRDIYVMQWFPVFSLEDEVIELGFHITDWFDRGMSVEDLELLDSHGLVAPKRWAGFLGTAIARGEWAFVQRIRGRYSAEEWKQLLLNAFRSGLGGHQPRLRKDIRKSLAALICKLYTDSGVAAEKEGATHTFEVLAPEASKLVSLDL
ncbi:hypothetical protein H9P43_005079 [Blastocladiella emersonii ATCC 22665]|nr:hypothetical protein H9P43_005079 [Blastocladiella emersonii ATCC 22665]